VLLKVRLVGWAIAAGITGVLGVALVVLRPQASYDPIGLAAGLLGTVSMAFGTVLTKRWGRPEGVGALAFTGWQLTAGGTLLVPVALLADGLPGQLSMVNVAGYGYLTTVGTALAYWLWFRGIAGLPASSVAFLALLSPVTAAAIGWAVLQQVLSPLQVTGGLIALVSTIAGQRAIGRRSAEPAGRTSADHRVAEPGTPVADLMPVALADDEAGIAQNDQVLRHGARRECVTVGQRAGGRRLRKVGQQRGSSPSDQATQRGVTAAVHPGQGAVVPAEGRM
jgi:hypothetical protein